MGLNCIVSYWTGTTPRAKFASEAGGIGAAWPLPTSSFPAIWTNKLDEHQTNNIGIDRRFARFKRCVVVLQGLKLNAMWSFCKVYTLCGRFARFTHDCSVLAVQLWLGRAGE